MGKKRHSIFARLLGLPTRTAPERKPGLPVTDDTQKRFPHARGGGPCKGGTQGKRQLPPPAFLAIQRAIAALGKDLACMAPDESLWPSKTSTHSRGVTSGTLYGNLQRYFGKAGLPTAGVHVFRHTAAKLRRGVGESVEDISRFLQHSSLAVTTVSLQRLEGQEDPGWQKAADAIGV